MIRATEQEFREAVTADTTADGSNVVVLLYGWWCGDGCNTWRSIYEEKDGCCIFCGGRLVVSHEATEYIREGQ